MKLRPYQQKAFEAVVDWFNGCIQSVVVEAVTAAGKSFIIAAIAHHFYKKTGKVVLCLAPSAELIQQNHEKYLLTGEKASIYSASAGSKCLKNPVVFGTPLTVKNATHKLRGKVAAVILDESHNIAPTIKEIISKMGNVAVIGLTATPYRLNDGYIYQVDDKGKTMLPDEAVEPYFHKLVYKITAQELLELGYLTPPVMRDTNEQYDTSNIDFRDQSTIDRAFEGHGRKTSAIISQVVEASRDRQGVMIFCATVRHAEEALASLPSSLSAMVTGETKKKERQEIVAKFKAKKIKYLVNVAVYTTGFDAPHVDLIAILRATESASLLQQIIGRSLRISEGKTEAIIMDFAGNIERHCPDGDIFNPSISAKRKGESIMAAVRCPDCNYANRVSVRPNNDGLEMNEYGYLVDLDGEEIKTSEGEPYPAHFGRRCQGFIKKGIQFEQCDYRWTHKVCEDCNHENDIAARYCKKCKGELVDPNEKLIDDFYKQKKNATEINTDVIESWQVRASTSQAGNETLKITWKTEWRTFTTWYMVGRKEFNDLCFLMFGRLAPTAEKLAYAINKGKGNKPTTVTYKKVGNFYKVYGYNKPEDKLTDEAAEYDRAVRKYGL